MTSTDIRPNDLATSDHNLYVAIFYSPPSQRVHERLITRFWFNGADTTRFTDNDWDNLGPDPFYGPSILRRPINWLINVLDRRHCTVTRRWAQRWANDGINPPLRWRA